jgi:hypothetical protein
VARALPPKAHELGLSQGTEVVMRRFIMQANIDKFTLLLETEADPTKRTMLVRLLGEEKTKLKELTIAEAREA